MNTNFKCVFFSITCNERGIFCCCCFFVTLKRHYCTTKWSLVMHLAFSCISFLQRYDKNYSDKAQWRKQSSVCTLGMSGSQDCIFNVHIKSKSCYDGRAPQSLSLFKGGKKSTNVNQSFLAMLLKIGEEGSKAPQLALPTFQSVYPSLSSSTETQVLAQGFSLTGEANSSRIKRMKIFWIVGLC